MKEIFDYIGPKYPDSLWAFKSNASAIEDINMERRKWRGKE
jgi:hypothetical protein